MHCLNVMSLYIYIAHFYLTSLMIEYKFSIYHKVCMLYTVLYISHSSMSYHIHLTHLHSRYTTLQWMLTKCFIVGNQGLGSHTHNICISVHVDVQVFNLGWIQKHPVIQPSTISTPHWWAPIRTKQLSVALPSLLDNWDYTIGCTLFIKLDCQ